MATTRGAFDRMKRTNFRCRREVMDAFLVEIEDTSGSYAASLESQAVAAK
jgi:hypothetical protein